MGRMLEWVAIPFSRGSFWPRDQTWISCTAGGFFTISESKSHSVVSDSLQPHILYSPWNSLGQNTGVGSLSLLQGIFPTQGLKPGLLHCRRILYQLCHQGSPKGGAIRISEVIDISLTILILHQDFLSHLESWWSLCFIQPRLFAVVLFYLLWI